MTVLSVRRSFRQILYYVYVNVNLRCSTSNAPVRAQPQAFLALTLQRIDLRQHGGNILLLLIEHGATQAKYLQEFGQLSPFPLRSEERRVGKEGSSRWSP